MKFSTCNINTCKKQIKTPWEMVPKTIPTSSQYIQHVILEPGHRQSDWEPGRVPARSWVHTAFSGQTQLSQKARGSQHKGNIS